jgi:type II secretory pathway pseudopilin PulG
VRRAFSLAEIVAVLVLASLVGTAIVATITRQHRFYRAASELLHVREGVRDAIEVLSTDISSASLADTVRLAADSAIEFFSTVGASVVCQSVGTEVGLPAANSSGNSLSAFVIEPDTGDLALFYTDSAAPGDQWERARITAFTSGSVALACPAPSRFSNESGIEVGAKGSVLALAAPLRRAARPGTVVRFVRRARYSLYNASDGDWYLGYRRCNAIGASSCGAVQPVSGPYRAYSSDPRATGLLFEYFDRAGQRVNPSAVRFAPSRVDVTARSESEYRLPAPERKGIADSATVSLVIRNTLR